jgi:L-fucose isomerase
METALAHIIATRRTFGLEITRLDMKLLADLLAKKAYKASEVKELRKWLDKMLGKRLMLKTAADGERFNQSLAMYLIVRDMMRDLNAVGGGFMSQLEWGSDPRGLPLPVADVMESLFNSSFDHTGTKAPIPYATESDMQGLLTMLFMSWLTGGNAPLFMDFRKVWEPWEIKALADKVGVKYTDKDIWATKGFVDGDNSGSASFDWAGLPGDKPEDIMKNVSMPIVDLAYFMGGGNSVTFVSPGGIEGIAGRMAYSALTDEFTLIWDEAHTTSMPEKLSEAVRGKSDYNWPHSWIVPKYASMVEYKQYAPANHLHMIWGLKPARLQYWMDLAQVQSATPWAARPAFIEGVDRPSPIIHIINGGEVAAKKLLKS